MNPILDYLRRLMKGDGMSKYLKFVAPLALSCLFVTACSSGDDDGGTPSADAMVISQADAMVQNQADAMVQSGDQAVGTTCTPGSGTECTQDAPTCLSQQGAANGFCSVTCGTSPDPGTGNDPTPPMNGDSVCAQAYTGTGTPACAVYTGTIGGGQDLTWYCGILCGDYMGTSLGTCESNLTCSNNFCEP